LGVTKHLATFHEFVPDLLSDLIEQKFRSALSDQISVLTCTFLFARLASFGNRPASSRHDNLLFDV
jgi:hypothetical protein